MTQRSLHLLAYDVAHPRRLKQALRATRRHASGGQKSVHECWLSGTEHAELLSILRSLLYARQDRLLSVRLDPRSPPRCLGIARAPEPPGFRIIG